MRAWIYLSLSGVIGFFLGDIFHNRVSTNNNTKDIAIEKFDELIEKFPTIKFIIIVGNHDIYYKSTRKVTSLKPFINRHSNLEIIKGLFILLVFLSISKSAQLA